MKTRRQIEAKLTAEINQLAGEKREGESLEDLEARVSRRAELAAKRQDLLAKRMVYRREIRDAVTAAHERLQYRRPGAPQRDRPGRGRGGKPDGQ